MNISRITRIAFAALAATSCFGASHAGNDDAPAPDAWTLVVDRPATGKYEDFAFPDPKNGWLINANGVVLHTTDGGATWTEQAKGLGFLRSVDFVDRRRGFAGTLTGKLYATTDGGVTWNDITAKLPHAAKGFCGITHVGQQVHIVGRYVGDGTDYFYSPDAGKTWRWTDLSAQAHGLVDVMFLNDKVGFIGGMGPQKPGSQFGAAIILKTTDAGKHWRSVFEQAGGRGFAWKLFPINNKLIYAGLQSEDGVYRVAKSTDAGEHWDTLTVATGRARGPGVQGIGFLDANRGWVGGFFDGMYATTDGGRTWSPLPTRERLVNRYEKVGRSLFTGSTRGILRYDDRGANRR